MSEKVKKQYRMGVLPKGDYSDSVMYDVNDWVNGADGQYASKRSGNIGHPLSDKEWWVKVVDLAKLNNAVKAATDATDAAVETNTEIRNAERDRVSAEQTREVYEVERKRHETERVTAEGNRASAENTRTTNENARSQAEQERQGAETNRVSAEQERMSHEQERVSAEQTRVSKEQERVAAETQRVLDEDNRKDAEAERQRVFTQHEAEREEVFVQREAGRTNTFNQHEVERDRKIDEAIAKFPVDAPKDGKKYGRKDGEWSEIKEGSDTPIDTELNPETADNEHVAGAKVTADKLAALKTNLSGKVDKVIGYGLIQKEVTDRMMVAYPPEPDMPISVQFDRTILGAEEIFDAKGNKLHNVAKNLTELDQKVGELAAVVGVANEELETIIG